VTEESRERGGESRGSPSFWALPTPVVCRMSGEIQLHRGQTAVESSPPGASIRTIGHTSPTPTRGGYHFGRTEGRIAARRLWRQRSHERQSRRERANREPRQTVTRLQRLGRIPERRKEGVVGLPQSIPDRLARSVEPRRRRFLRLVGSGMRSLPEHRPDTQDRGPSLHPGHSRVEPTISATRFRYASGVRCAQQGNRLAAMRGSGLRRRRCRSSALAGTIAKATRGGNGSFPVAGETIPTGNGPIPVHIGRMSTGNGPIPVRSQAKPTGNEPFPTHIVRLWTGNGTIPVEIAAAATGTEPIPVGIGGTPTGNGPFPFTTRQCGQGTVRSLSDARGILEGS
jgi:hypothetical protein